MGSGLLVLIAAVLGFIAVAGVGLAFVGGDSQSRTVKRAHAIAVRKRPEARARAAPDPTERVITCEDAAELQLQLSLIHI